MGPTTPRHYSIVDAATLAGCVTKTIKRKLSAGELPNAHKDERGRWQIPLADLIDAGLYDPDADEQTATATL